MAELWTSPGSRAQSDIAPDEHNCNTARGETPDGADDHQLLVVRARAFGNAPTGAVCAGIMRLGLLPKDLGLSAIRSERLR